MTIKQTQHLLAFLGYYVGAVDGVWGTLSRTALQAFQKDFGGIEITKTPSAESEKALRHAVAFWYDEVDATPVESSDVIDWSKVPHFTEDELACKCKQYHAPYCDGFPHKIQPLLVEILERCREQFGTPIVVVSGLRCKQHNADSGGVSNSQHMYGEACDIYVSGANPETVLKWFQNQSDVRYAYRISGSDNIHFDIQPVGK